MSTKIKPVMLCNDVKCRQREHQLCSHNLLHVQDKTCHRNCSNGAHCESVENIVLVEDEKPLYDIVQVRYEREEKT